MYEDVNKFLIDQTWRLPKEDTKASGTTWLELFILFDTLGYRRKESRTPKNVASAARTKERQAANKHQRKERGNAETAEPRASLAEELEAFKRVVRHTMRQDGNAEQAKWFNGDTKTQYRRLKALGITEHQPAIVANCEVDPITMMDVEEAIVIQKARGTRKQLMQFKDARSKSDGDGLFLLRKSKVDVRSCPKWKRVEVESTLQPSIGCPQGGQAESPHCVEYASRMISCPVCKEQVQTAMMQLFTPLSFRYMSCSGCEKQRWSRGWLCECGIAWHTCNIHRVDPAVHRSAKPPKRKAEPAKAEHSFKDSERPAPDAVQSASRQPLKRAKGTRKMHAHGMVVTDKAEPSIEALRISEKWRLRLEARRGPRSKNVESSHNLSPGGVAPNGTLATEDVYFPTSATGFPASTAGCTTWPVADHPVIIGDGATKDRKIFFEDQVDRAPDGTKRRKLAIEGNGNGGKVTRESLRKALHAQASEQKVARTRDLESHPNPSGPSSSKKRKAIPHDLIKGKNAIERIIIAGLHCDAEMEKIKEKEKRMVSSKEDPPLTSKCSPVARGIAAPVNEWCRVLNPPFTSFCSPVARGIAAPVPMSGSSGGMSAAL